jgi:hypothetical protein
MKKDSIDCIDRASKKNALNNGSSLVIHTYWLYYARRSPNAKTWTWSQRRNLSLPWSQDESWLQKSNQRAATKSLRVFQETCVLPLYQVLNSPSPKASGTEAATRGTRGCSFRPFYVQIFASKLATVDEK